MNPPGRVPPHSVEAEEQLLSACLLDGGETLNRCVESKIRPASFYVPANRLIYERLCQMQDATKPIDMPVLAEELKTTGNLDEVGGYPYLIRISGRIPTTAGAGYFIEKVRELAVLRDCIRAATGIVEDAYNYTGGIDGYVGKAEASLLAATQDRIAGESSHVGDLADTCLADFAEWAKKPGQITGLRTGFADIDRITGGLRPAEMIVLAGRPSCGKTALAMNMAENVAIPRAGIKPETVWVASLEMSKPQLGRRLMAQRARVNVKRAMDGLVRPGSAEWQEYEQARRDFKACKMFIDDQSGMTVSMIAAKARRIQQRYGLGLIVVDYLQLVAPNDPSTIREQQVAEASRGMKALAKELNVPLVLLAQLNRAAEKENRAPRLSDLRESGSVEQDADVVLMLNRPKEEGDTHQVAAPTMDCYIHKNRNGEVGECRLTFVPQITRFENYTQ